MKNFLMFINMVLDVVIILLLASLLFGCSSTQRYKTKSSLTIEVRDQNMHPIWSKTWEKEETHE